MPIADQQLKQIIEAAIMAAGEPLSIDKLLTLFVEEKEPPTREAVKAAIKQIEDECENRGVELKKISSGYRFQAKKDFSSWVSLLWEEKPARYSRALLETLVLIAYKQPLTRGEIEHVRGVAVSTHIIKTLLEREWVKVVGHRDVPGKPALYATTKSFLDYFNLNSLEELPTLAEIRDLDKINAELDLLDPNLEMLGPDNDTNIQEHQLSDQQSPDSSDEEDIDSNLEDRDDIQETSPVGLAGSANQDGVDADLGTVATSGDAAGDTDAQELQPIVASDEEEYIDSNREDHDHVQESGSVDAMESTDLDDRGDTELETVSASDDSDGEYHERGDFDSKFGG
jgi:segregation and condensation protein B